MDKTRDSNASLFLGILIFGAVCWLGYSLITGSKEEWKGMYESRITGDIVAVSFSTREECSNWVGNKHLYPGDGFNHECGKNCTLRPSGILYSCEETFD